MEGVFGWDRAEYLWPSLSCRGDLVLFNTCVLCVCVGAYPFTSRLCHIRRARRVKNLHNIIIVEKKTCGARVCVCLYALRLWDAGQRDHRTDYGVRESEKV